MKTEKITLAEAIKLLKENSIMVCPLNENEDDSYNLRSEVEDYLDGEGYYAEEATGMVETYFDRAVDEVGNVDFEEFDDETVADVANAIIEMYEEDGGSAGKDDSSDEAVEGGDTETINLMVSAKIKVPAGLFENDKLEDNWVDVVNSFLGDYVTDMLLDHMTDKGEAYQERHPDCCTKYVDDAELDYKCVVE